MLSFTGSDTYQCIKTLYDYPRTIPHERKQAKIVSDLSRLPIMVGHISSSNWPTHSSQTRNASSIKEIYHIAFLLRQVLVPDLIPQILSYADIYLVSTFCKKHDLIITREQSPQICLFTPPIWSRARRKNPVVKVSFRIQGRDEGLNLGIGRSFFTAALVREQVSEHSGAEGYLKALEHPVPESQRHICTNAIASDIYETHVVEWRSDAEDPEESSWVARLRAGDRIVVKGHAQWATFSNHVAEVEVRVYTQAVVR